MSIRRTCVLSSSISFTGAVEISLARLSTRKLGQTLLNYGSFVKCFSCGWPQAPTRRPSDGANHSQFHLP